MATNSDKNASHKMLGEGDFRVDKPTVPFTLYYAAYSICSMMVRVTFALRGKPREGHPDITLKSQVVDISFDNPEQLTEFYLCKVNPDGQVPVLANDKVLSKPMPESVDITWYICDWYPSLLPPEHESTIRSLIAELHEINYGLLTFGGQSRHLGNLETKVQDLLRQDGISPSYRKALEHKSQVLLRRQGTVSSDAVPEHELRARIFFAKIMDLMKVNGIERATVDRDDMMYIFGPKPTALDAHVLVLLRRLHDVKRNDLVPDGLVKWADEFSEGEDWNSILVNGSTLPPYVA